MDSIKKFEDELDNIKKELNQVIDSAQTVVQMIESFEAGMTLDNKIVYLRNKGMSYRKIADSLGLSTVSVFRHAKELGLTGDKN